jgi:hypothetical protein
VVILTSNLGAESYRQGMAGFTTAGSVPIKSQASEHFARAVEQFLRPEMFNRLDRVVPFAPLEAGTIRRIADREWQKILNRDGVRFREVSLTSSPDLLDHLAAIGFDARYGARPLKRAMERELLSPLARQMNRHPGDTPVTVTIGIAAGKPDVAVRPVLGPRGRSNREPTGRAGKLASTVQALRRWHQLVASSSTVRELDNEVYQLVLAERRIYRKQLAKKKLIQPDTEILTRLGRLRELAEEVKRQRNGAYGLENDAVTAFHDGSEPADELFQRLAEANRDWDRLLLRLYALNAPSSDTVTLAMFAEHREHLAELAAAYCAVAQAQGLSVQMISFDLPGDGNEPIPPALMKPPGPKRPPLPSDSPTTETQLPPTVWLGNRLYATNPAKLILVRRLLEPSRTEEYAKGETLGLALMFKGTGAHVRFWGEAGLHEIRNPDNREAVNPHVLVFAEAEELFLYRPPEAIVRRGFLKDHPLRREYDIGKGTMRDIALDRVWAGLSGSLTYWVEPAVIANMRMRLLRLIVE